MFSPNKSFMSSRMSFLNQDQLVGKEQILDSLVRQLNK